MKDHKPVVVVSGETNRSWCRLCGVPVTTRVAGNGRHVRRHDTSTEERFPVLGADLKPVL